MPLTFPQLVLRSVVLAGLDSTAVPDADSVLRHLAPQTFYDVATLAARDEKRRKLVMQAHTIAMTNGQGTLPAGVLSEFLEHAVLLDTADATTWDKMRFCREYDEYVRITPTAAGNLGLFTVNGDDFFARKSGVAFSLTTGFTGNLSLTAASAPVIPASDATNIDASEEILRESAGALAEFLATPALRIAVTHRTGGGHDPMSNPVQARRLRAFTERERRDAA